MSELCCFLPPSLSVAEHSRRFYCLFELLSDVFVLGPGHQAPYYVGSEQAQVLNIGIRVTAEPSGNEVKTSGKEILNVHIKFKCWDGWTNLSMRPNF